MSFQTENILKHSTKITAVLTATAAAWLMLQSGAPGSDEFIAHLYIAPLAAIFFVLAHHFVLRRKVRKEAPALFLMLLGPIVTFWAVIGYLVVGPQGRSIENKLAVKEFKTINLQMAVPTMAPLKSNSKK